MTVCVPIDSVQFGSQFHHEDVHNVYLSMFLNAGWLGGIWAAAAAGGAAGRPAHSLAVDIARSAVWLHGHAADRCGLRVLRASGLIEQMVAAQA